MGLLPEAAPRLPGIDISATCLPASHVGGDYYQYVLLDADGRKLCIFQADVSGHGMQAATVAMRFNEVLRYEVKGRTSPTEMLEALDASLRGNIPEGMFVTCSAAILDPAAGTLSVASAGSPETYCYLRADDAVRPLGLTGLPLGLPASLLDAYSCQTTVLQLAPGDVVVFASDGVEEAQDRLGRFYEGERLSEVIRTTAAEAGSAEAVRDAIVQDVERSRSGQSQVDDVTVVVLRIA
jgi:sigma-B regulation protein RsbU (phosphoserine phosphatase)